MVQRQCSWLYRYYRCYDFVIDDEKYFTLSHFINNSYFASFDEPTPEDIVYDQKQKFEPKVMLWIAISKNIMSEPFFQKRGLAIDQNVCKIDCIQKRLIPFLKTKHSDNNYMFWPDKASAHYAKSVTQLLDSKNVRYVPKYRNPTNVPQCRPI